MAAEDAAGNKTEDSLAVTYTPFDADGGGLADAWEMQVFGHLALANGASDTGSRGVRDFLKFAFGMDPTALNLSALPQSSLEVSGSDTWLMLRYRQRMVPGKLAYLVGVSPDLVNWNYTENGIVQIGLPIPTGDGFTEEVTVGMAVPFGSLGRYFIRLEVMQVP